MPMNRFIKHITIITILSITCFTVFAQEEDDNLPPQTIDPQVRQKVEAARIGLISERLGLTPAQAEKFWPV